MGEPPATGGRTKQFADDDILRATIALIETEGIGRLTMRRLGTALGVEAMAIYRYFPSRQDLISALVDWLVLQTASDPELQFDHADDWRDYLDRLAHGIRQMALTHPRVFPLIATTPTAAPWLRPPMRSLEWVDSFLTGLQDHHFPPPAAVTIYKQFSSFLLGHLLLEVAALDTSDPASAPASAGNDSDRRAAGVRRRKDAAEAETTMQDGDGPVADEVLQSGADDRILAEEPTVQSADPDATGHATRAASAGSANEADLPLSAAVPTTTGIVGLDDYPQVQALAGLLAEDTAPADFETQLDRLLIAFADMRRN